MSIHYLKIRKKQKKEADEFFRIFEKYQETLYRIAFIYVKNKEDALDVVQETAYRSFKSFHTRREPKYTQTWLIKIAISCSIDLLRKRNKVVPIVPHQMTEMVESDSDLDDEMTVHLSLQQVMEVLDEMEKSVILLRYYQDFTFQETADLLAIPLGTSKTILYRALHKMRLAIKGEWN